MMRKKSTRKAKTRKAKTAAPTVVPGGGLVDLGKRVSVAVKKYSADFLECTLDDGTVFQIKPMIMGVERSLEKYNQLGDPIYQVQAGIMINTVVPKRLKRKVTP
jgi:hypothetical protein